VTQLREAPAARPFALAREEGERIWFGGSAMTIKASAATTGGLLTLIETRSPIGHGPPLHVHHDEDEAFYVIEGALEIVCGQARYEAGEGAFAFLPRGIAHTFRVVSDVLVRMLTIAVPGGLENFFRDAGAPAEHDGFPPAGPIDTSGSGRSRRATAPRSWGRRSASTAHSPGANRRSAPGAAVSRPAVDYTTRSASRVLSSRRMILPVEVLGRSGTNCTERGTL
jgi:mannose-6-phosphate isomerase-like protein (cupin superfamily)